jgi:hypothetical protein
VIQLFTLITHAKVAKIVLPEEPANSQPFGLSRRAFFIYKLFSRKRRISKTNVVYIIKQILYHIVFKILYCILYEGNRRGYSYFKRKGAEEVKYQKYLNFQTKGLLPDRTLESFKRSTDGAIPKL